MSSRRFILNVGGTKYEVSESLLDQFQDSMLRQITSDRWNESNDSSDPDHSKEIFIERDSGRFKFILDYMRDGRVALPLSLPLSIPRRQFIKDMLYYGIDIDESKIALDVADPDDIFHKFSEFFHQKKKFKDIFEPKPKGIDVRYRKLAAESVSCTIASRFFERLFSDDPSSTFDAKHIKVLFDEKHQYRYKIGELQPHLNQFGLKGSNLRIRESTREDFDVDELMNPLALILEIEHQQIVPKTIETDGGENDNIAVCEETPSKGETTSKRTKLNVGGVRYDISNSLLDRFHDSMLSRIISDTIQNESNGDSSNPDKNKEIFIDRDGVRFKFVLDYMRDGEVVLPLSVPRPQLVNDMEYFGIDFDESQITLCVADPKETYHKLSEFYYETEIFKTRFESKKKDIEARYRTTAVESVSYAIAFDFFGQQFSGKSFLTFGTKNIYKILERKERYNYAIEELQPHLNRLGLCGSDIEQREEALVKQFYSKEPKMERVEKPSYIDIKMKML